ncbi:MAG: response regulator [Candidatus Aminicenantes bacterium]|nr:response regulator [Candidatus Aminicenantes bacterium]
MSKNRENILVIDDDPDFFESIRLMLTASGYSVFGAGTGEEGFDKAVQDKPDVIILDLMLPDMDGYAVCRNLKDDVRTVSIPVIMATSLQSASAKNYMGKIAKHHMADDYMEKPLKKDELLSKIKSAISRKIPSPSPHKIEKSILVIDDDPDILMSMQTLLQARGLEVFIAENSLEGLKLARTFTPDVILLDVMLPDKDGFSTCAELKKDKKTMSIPVVIVSAVGEEFTKPEYAKNIAEDHMADGFLSKPVKTDELMDLIDVLLEKK